jgi:hypothetical protein
MNRGLMLNRRVSLFDGDITDVLYQGSRGIHYSSCNPEKIWVECTCDYEGFADMIKFEGMKYKHPVCPDCGELIEDIEDYHLMNGIKKLR